MEERSGAVIGPRPAVQVAERSQLGPRTELRNEANLAERAAGGEFLYMGGGALRRGSQVTRTAARPRLAFRLRNVAKCGLEQSCGTKPIWRSGRTVGMGCHICFPAGIWLLGPCRGREKPVPFSSRGGIQAATSAFRTCSTDESGVGCPRAAPGAGRGCETRRFPAGERRFFILRLAGGLGGGWVSGA